jgi:hypothetical protein
VGSWEDDDANIMVGKRRMRAKKHAERRPLARVLLVIIIVLLVAVGVAGYWWLHRPTGLAALPNPAVVAPGGFRVSIEGRTITVGLQIENTTNQRLTLLGARIIAPAGVKQTALAILPSGTDNQGFALSGALPSATPLTVGSGADREAVIAARFSLDCKTVLASAAATDEQIFVTIRVGNQSREEELTPPVVDSGDDSDTAVTWLTGTARQACTGKIPTGSTPQSTG